MFPGPVSDGRNAAWDRRRQRHPSLEGCLRRWPRHGPFTRRPAAMFRVSAARRAFQHADGAPPQGKRPPPLSGGTHRPRTTIPSTVRILRSRRDAPEGSSALRGAPFTTEKPAHKRPPRARRDKAPSGQGVARGPCVRPSRPVAWRRWAAFHWAALGAGRVHTAPVTCGAAQSSNASRVYGNLPCGAVPLAARSGGKALKKAPSCAARSPSAFYRVPKMRSPASPRPGMM